MSCVSGVFHGATVSLALQQLLLRWEQEAGAALLARHDRHRHICHHLSDKRRSHSLQQHTCPAHTQGGPTREGNSQESYACTCTCVPADAATARLRAELLAVAQRRQLMGTLRTIALLLAWPVLLLLLLLCPGPLRLGAHLWSKLWPGRAKQHRPVSSRRRELLFWLLVARACWWALPVWRKLNCSQYVAALCTSGAARPCFVSPGVYAKGETALQLVQQAGLVQRCAAYRAPYWLLRNRDWSSISPSLLAPLFACFLRLLSYLSPFARPLSFPSDVFASHSSPAAVSVRPPVACLTAVPNFCRFLAPATPGAQPAAPTREVIAMDWRFSPQRHEPAACSGPACSSDAPTGPAESQQGWRAAPLRQAGKDEPERILLILPGVGGDASASYVQDVSECFVKQGWHVCVLYPRGMGDASPPLDDLGNLCLPHESWDLHALVTALSRLGAATSSYTPPDAPASVHAAATAPASPFPVIFIVGFSLGAIMVGKYLTSFASHVDRLPCHLKGVVLVSGAFQLDFSSWWRYEMTYQRLFVPALVQDLLRKYTIQLSQLLSEAELRRLSRADTFRKLVEHVLVPIRQRALLLRGAMSSPAPPYSANALVADQQTFQAHLSSKPSDLTELLKPTLFLASLDDPLHNPTMIGLPREMPPKVTTQGKSSSASSLAGSSRCPSESQLVYMLTAEGGHVAWPCTLSEYICHRIFTHGTRATDSYRSTFGAPLRHGFMAQTVLAFVEATLRLEVHPHTT